MNGINGGCPSDPMITFAFYNSSMNTNGKNKIVISEHVERDVKRFT